MPGVTSKVGKGWGTGTESWIRDPRGSLQGACDTCHAIAALGYLPDKMRPCRHGPELSCRALLFSRHCLSSPHFPFGLCLARPRRSLRTHVLEWWGRESSPREGGESLELDGVLKTEKSTVFSEGQLAPSGSFSSPLHGHAQVRGAQGRRGGCQVQLAPGEVPAQASASQEENAAGR